MNPDFSGHKKTRHLCRVFFDSRAYCALVSVAGVAAGLATGFFAGSAFLTGALAGAFFASVLAAGLAGAFLAGSAFAGVAGFGASTGAGAATGAGAGAGVAGATGSGALTGSGFLASSEPPNRLLKKLPFFAATAPAAAAVATFAGSNDLPAARSST